MRTHLRTVGPRRALAVPTRKRWLGDSGWVDAVTGQPITDNPIQVPPAAELLLPPVPLDQTILNPSPAPSWLTQFFTSTPLPSVTPSTLLQAAALPNAPAAVRQAAAQYSSANPVSSFFSGTTGGLPNMILFGGVGLVLLLVVAKGKR